MDVRTWLRNGGIFLLPVIVFGIAYLATSRVWQDYLMLLGTLLIAVTLVPTLLEPDAAVPRTTSIPAAIAVAMFVIGTAGLDLWLTAAANALALIFWILVIIYRAA